LREVADGRRLHSPSAPDGPPVSHSLALPADLFFADISMSGMDGWKVAETLRTNGHHQARILMVSASALEAHGAPLAQPFTTAI